MMGNHLYLFGLLALLFATITSALDGPDNLEVCEGQLIPGIARMARGVDITELDLTPSNLHNANGYRSTIFAFTCAEKRTWTNPTAGDVEYKQPDQIGGVNTLPAGQLKAKIELSGDTDEYKQTRGLKVGLEIDTVRFGAYSASMGLKNVQENIYRSNRSIAETSATVSAIQVDFKAAHTLQLTADFQNFLPTSPVKKYEDLPDLYDDFVATYGTHFYQYGIFGGYLYLKTAINEQYMMSSDETEITSNLEASFASKVKVKTDTEHNKKKVSESFKKNSQTEFYYYGGTPVTIPEDDPIGWMEQWVPTVNKDPWLFAGQLKPIELLLKNYEVRGEVRKAIAIKMAKAYLEELKYVVRLGKFKLKSEEQATVDSVERKLKSRDRKDTEALVKDLEKIFISIQNLRDRALLAQLKSTWNSKIPDIIECKTYLISACARNLVETNRQDTKAALEFPAKIDALSGQSGILDHEDVQALIREAGKLTAFHLKPIAMCPPGRYQDECKQCIKIGADYGVKATKNPFCRTPEAWKVIDYTPIFPGRR